MQAVIQPHPCIQLVDPVHDRLPVQTPRAARLVTPGHCPTAARCRVRRDLIPCVLPDPPPSTAAQCPSALEERGPQLKAPAYVGISVKRIQLLRRSLSRNGINTLEKISSSHYDQNKAFRPFAHNGRAHGDARPSETIQQPSWRAICWRFCQPMAAR
jgi:hypothetical protein